MRKKYEELYQVYLELAKEKEWETEDDLRYAIMLVEAWKSQLFGMVMLLERCGGFTFKESQQQEARIREDFSSSRLYGAIMTASGEVFMESELRWN